MSKRNFWVVSFALAVSACVLFTVSSFADSQVRIVRLSSVEGDVKIDRATGQNYEKAFLNLPVTRDMKVRTGSDGRAEVEFEDGSTIRLAPSSVLEFRELGLRDSGGKVSTVYLQEGAAYLNFTAAKDDQFTLNFGHEKLSLVDAAHLRVRMDDTKAALAVFKGDVRVDGPSGSVEVGKKQSATFDLADKDQYTVAKSLEQDPYDAWDKEQNAYHERYMASSNSYSGYSPYAYGTSDLNYYGSFMNVAGYGNVWQPYFAGAGWDPFMNGAWAYSPGFGYQWVSAYPWGWTPYHTGSWVYAPGNGWLWQPGGSWSGFGIPRVINPPAHYGVPVPPPTTGGHTTVAVNRGAVGVPTGSTSRKLVIQNGSAGLGIPRGGVRNLARMSQEVSLHGSATATMHPAAVATATAPPASNAGTSMSRAGSSRPTSGTMRSGSSRGVAPHATTIPHH